MTITFSDQKKRDDFIKRLDDLSFYMLRSFDQGNDGRIWVTEMMIDDVRAAAAIIRQIDVVTLVTGN